MNFLCVQMNNSLKHLKIVTCATITTAWFVSFLATSVVAATISEEFGKIWVFIYLLMSP